MLVIISYLYNMKWLNKLLGKETSNLIKSSTELIDEVVTSEEERSALKENLTKILSNSYTRVLEAQASVINKEAEGNFLQRSWRPIIMLTFGVVILIAVFTETHLGTVPDKFWNLLTIGIGGYIGGRSIEKLGSTVTKNIDLGMLRKKDRKDFIE